LISHYLWLIPLGLVVGAFGTLIGAGGGFVLVPILLLLYPQENPEIITSISLAVVFFNALSGTAAYARMKRVDFKSGLLFSIATVPGAILGAYATSYVPRRAFDLALGVLLLVAAAYLFLNPHRRTEEAAPESSRGFARRLQEANGTEHVFSYNPWLAMGISLVVGFFSSLLGIGGGIIHVPVLAHLLNFPVHIATATSHFTLAVMALAGTIVHIATGTFHHGLRRAACLTIGVLAGAQIGAYFSNRLKGKWIMRGLALSLGLVGVHLLMVIF